MKHIIQIVILLFAIACEPLPDPIPEPPKLSELIVGNWENKIHETGVEYYYFTFSNGSYFVEYDDGEDVLTSDAGGYFLNDETGEIELEEVLIRDYEAGKLYTFAMPTCFVLFSNENNTMIWTALDGTEYIFNKL